MDFTLLTFIVTVLISKTEFTVGELVFVQTGSSVQLDIQCEKQSFKKMIWLNDKSEHIVKFTINPKQVNLHPSYTKRVDFNNETFSLTIRNMQKTDSGVYKARATGNSETYIAEHSASVLDPVETPVLTLLNYTMINVNSCVVNVACIGQNLTLNSSYHSNCSQLQEVKSSKIHNLALYCKEEVVVCNFSNPVSWRNDTIKIKQLCTTSETVISEHHSKENSIFSSTHWLAIAVSVSLLLLAVATVLYFYRKFKKDQQTENTIYAEVGPNKEVKTDMQMSERSENPHTVYGSESFVQGHQEQLSTRECHLYNEVPERRSAKTKRGNNHPQTTYCTIGQHKKPLVDTEKEISIYSVVSKAHNGKPADNLDK